MMIATRKDVLIVLFAASGLAVRIEKSTSGYDPQTFVDEARAVMEQAWMDFHAQGDACSKLNRLSQRNRGSPGPFGGKRVADKWLTAGLYEVVAQGLLNILAVPPSATSEHALFTSASTCFNTMIGPIVQNDETKSLLLYRNSPHLWDAFVGYFERFKSQPSVLASNCPLCMFAGLYGNWGVNERDSLSEISRGLDRAGGFKFILDILEHNYTTPHLFQGATAALSDHLVGSKDAPKILADNNDGIRLLTNGVRHAQGAPLYHEENGFGLRYEILEDVTGLLKNDDNGRFAKGFAEEGLMEEVTKLMPEETTDLYFQDHCCQVFNWMTNSNPSAQQKLADSAAAELVQKVVTEPYAGATWPPPVSRWANLKNSDPPPSCVFLYQNLQQFLQGNAQWKDWSMRERQP